MSNRPETHAEYFAAYGIELEEEHAENLVQSVGRTAGICQAPTTLIVGRVIIQARPSAGAIEVEMGSLTEHPALTKDPP